jgi:DNA-binding response OmpR family regulator
LITDGLGHGPTAAEASQRAIHIFHQCVMSPLGELFDAMHHALRPTRGAVVAVAEINRAEQQVHYCGVRNISATLLTSQSSRNLVSLNWYHWPSTSYADGIFVPLESADSPRDALRRSRFAVDGRTLSGVAQTASDRHCWHSELSLDVESDRLPILIIEDDPQTLFLYDTYLRGSPFHGLLTRSLYEAEQVLLQIRPQALVLDIMLLGGDSWNFLVEMKAQSDSRSIPIVVVSTVEDQRKGLALGADVYKVKPISAEWLLATLRALTSRTAPPRVLIIDDEEMSRYLLSQFIDATTWLISEAATGLEGVRKAQEEQPAVIFLDLNLPGLDGYEILVQLRTDPLTKSIPIVIHSAKLLSPHEEAWLRARATTVIAKNALSRETVATVLDDVRKQRRDPAGRE